MQLLPVVALGLLLLAGLAPASAQKIIINHSCTDLAAIPPAYIDSAKASLSIHYAHKSHGRQIVYGMDSIAAAMPNLTMRHSDVSPPAADNELSIYNPGRFIGQHLATLRNDLNANPQFNTSMFMWCLETIGYIDPYQGAPLTREQLRAVLDSFALWQEDFPAVRFVYFTASAHHVTPASSYNRYLRNQEIREECAARDGILFDFEDLDTWYYDSSAAEWKHNTIDYTPPGGSPMKLPIMYTERYGNPDTDPSGTHANGLSQRMKASAAWWMFAEMAGWNPSGPTAVKAKTSGPTLKSAPARAGKALRVPPPVGSAEIYDVRGAKIPAASLDNSLGHIRPVLIVPKQ